MAMRAKIRRVLAPVLAGLLLALLASPTLAQRRYERVIGEDGRPTWRLIENGSPATAPDAAPTSEQPRPTVAEPTRPSTETRRPAAPEPSRPTAGTRTERTEPAIPQGGHRVAVGIAPAIEAVAGERFGPFLLVSATSSTQPDGAGERVVPAVAPAVAEQPSAPLAADTAATQPDEMVDAPADAPAVADVPDTQPDIADVNDAPPAVADAPDTQPDIAGDVSTPADTAPLAPAQAVRPAEPGPKLVYFVFDNQPWSNVLAWISKLTGMSIIGAEVPGTVIYRSPRGYAADEILPALNNLLMTRGFYIDRDRDHLVVVPLANIARMRQLPVYRGELPAEKVHPSDIVTFVMPVPSGATLMATQVRPLISNFGAVAAMGDQNLVITDTVASIRSIQTLLNSLSSPSATQPDSVLTVFPLQHVGPDEMLATLRQLIGRPVTVTTRTQQGEQRRVEYRLPGSILADRRTHSIVALVTEEDSATIRRIIDELDIQVEEPLEMETRVFVLENTDVNRAAEIIRNTFSSSGSSGGGRRDPRQPGAQTGEIRITVDPQFRRLIITAGKARMRDIEELIENTIEKQATGQLTEIFKIIRLESAACNQVAAAIRQFIRPQRDVRLDISEDPRTNSLMLQSNSQATIDRVIELIGRLDPKAGPTSRPDLPARTIHLVELKSIEAAQANQHIQAHLIATGKLGEPRPIIDAAGANVMLISCVDRQWPLINDLLNDLERVSADNRTTNEIIPIQFQRPTEIERAVQQFFGAGGGGFRGRQSAGGAVRTVADDARKLLIVDATPTVMQQVKDLIRKLDVASVGVDPASAETRTYRAVNSQQARQAVESLRKHLADELATGKIVASFNIDDPTATIFVSARGDDFQAIEEKLGEVLGLLSPQAMMKQFVLQHSPAAQVVATLQGMIATRPQPNIVADHLRLTANERTNAILAWGTRPALDAVDALIRQLDTPPDSPEEQRSYEFASSAEARNVSNALGRVFAGEITAGRMRARFETISDTGLLFVTARGEDFPRIIEMIEKIRAGYKAMATTQQVPLNHVQARDLTAVIEQIVAGQGGQVKVAGAPDGRRVVISGSVGDVEKAIALIKDFDQPEQFASPFRAIMLKSADPAAVAATLTEIFQPSNDVRRRSRQAEIRFRGDAATGRLFVLADEATFAAIEPIIKTLDVEVDVETRVVKLTKGRAESIAAMLSNLYTGRPGFAGARIVPDAAQNAVIISAATRQLAELARMAGDLDGGVVVAEAETRQYELGEGLSAEPLARALELAFAEPIRRQEMAARFQAETLSNTLIVTAAPKDFDLIVKQIDRLRTRIKSRTSLRQFNAPDGTAYQWVAMLQNVMAPRQADRPAAEQLRLSSDPAGTTIVAVGAIDLLDMVEEVIKSFQSDAKPTLRIIKLAGDPAQVANTVRESLGIGRPAAGRAALPGAAARITPDAATNSLIVTGPEIDVVAVERLVNDLEQGNATVTQVYTVKTEHILPTDLMALLRSLYERQQQRAPMTMSVAPGGDRLLINTTAKQFEAIAKLVESVDIKPENPINEHWIPVIYVRPADILENLREIMSSKFGPSGWKLEVDATDTLVLTGTAEHLSWASSAVNNILDVDTGVPFGETETTVIIPLGRDVSALRMAKAVQDLGAQSGGPLIEVRQFQQPSEAHRIIIQDMNRPRPAAPQPAPAVPPTTQPDSRSQSNSAGQFSLPMPMAQIGHMLHAAALGQSVPEQGNGPEEHDDGENGTIVPPTTGPRVGQTVRVDRPATSGEAGKQDSTRIYVDPNTNVMIVQGPPSQVKAIEELVKSLAQSTAGPDHDFRIFKLSAAPPDAMATMLERLFNVRTATAQQAQPGQQPGQPGADQQGGRRGQAGGQQAAAQQAAQQQAAQRTAQQQAAAAAAAARRIIVVPDLRTNSIVVRAASADMPVIEAMIYAMDVELPGSVLEVQIFTLVNIDAAEAERNLKALFRLTAGGGAAAGAQELGALREQVIQMARDAKLGSEADMLKLINAGRMTITANAAANSLVVAAPPEGLTLVKMVLDQLDKAPVLVESKVERVQLEHARADQLAPVFQSLFVGRTQQQQAAGRTRQARASSQLVVTADVRSNSLIVRAAESDMEDIKKLIKELDQKGVGESVPRIYRLKFADAASLGQAIERMVRGSAATGRRPAAGDGGQVQIATDPVTNTLLVSASELDHKQIKSLIDELDQDGVAAQQQTFQLKHAQASDLAPVLQTTFAAQQRATGRGAQQAAAGTLMITPEPRLNRLIVTGNEARIAEVAKLIEELDQPDDGKGNFQVYLLKNADANTVGRALQEIIRPERGQVSSVRIAIDQSSNSVLVRGGPADHEMLGKIIAQMEDAGAATPQTKVYTIRNAQAADVANAINNVLRGQPRRQGRPVAQVSAEPTSNKIIALAVPEEQALIASVIDDVDKPDGGLFRTVQPVTLVHANAVDVVNALQPLYAAQRGARGGAVGPTITAEARANTVMIKGTDQEIKEVQDLISKLDNADARGVIQTRTVTLVNSDAVEVAPMVQRVLDQAMQNTATPGQRAQRLAVGADSRTNTIVLAGAETQFKMAEDLVKQLDDINPQAGGLKVYVVPLKKSSADEVQRVLQQVITGGQTGRGGQPAGGARLLPGARVNVSSAPGANSLIIHSDETTFAELKKLIDAIEDAGPAERKVQVFPLTNAQAQPFANTLRQMFTDIARVPGRTQRPEDQVSIIAETTTNSVVVAASAEKMGEVAELIKQLDGVPLNPQGFEVLPLQGADAARTATLLTQLLRQAQPGLRFSITADTRNNLLIVSAPESMMPQVKKLLELVDRDPPFAEAVMTVVPLRNASAARLAPIITNMLRRGPAGAVTATAAALQEQIRRMKVVTPDGKAVSQLDLDKPINVLADPDTNMLIISSSQENVAALSAVLAVMDIKPQVEGFTLQVYPVRHGDANAIGQQLTDLFNRSRQTVIAPGGTAAARPGQVEMGTVVGKALTNPLTLSVDRRTNSVVIAGVEEAVALAVVLIGKLDVPAAVADIETRILPVQHGDSGLLAPMLTELFDRRLAASLPPGAQPLPGDRVSLAVEPLTNSIVAVGKPENLAQLVDLLSKLDIEPPAQSGLVRFYVLEYADAATVANMIGQVFRTGVYVPGRTTTAARPEDRVTISHDVRSNAMIVSASRQNLLIIEQMLKDLDRDLPNPIGDFRLFPVANADATKVATLMQQLFDRKVQAARQAGQTFIAPTILSDARSNTLIVAGRKENYDEVERLLPDLDKKDAAATVDFKLFALKNAAASTLGPMLSTLMSNRRTPTGAGQTAAPAVPVSIAVDVGSNSLIVAATRDDMLIIAGLVNDLDKPAGTFENTQVFQLQKADAATMADTLNRLNTNRPDARSINISVDPRLNAVVVRAAKADMEEIADLIRRLDHAPIDELMDWRIIRLDHADASDLATLLTNMLRDPPAATRATGGPRATIINFMANTEGAAQAISTQKDKIIVTAELRTNSIVVAAPAESMPMMALLIKELDKPARILHQVEIFQIKNADAGQMAEVIKELFKIGQTTTGRAGQQPDQQFRLETPGAGAGVLPVAAPAAPAPSAGPGPAVSPGGVTPSALRPELSIVVNSRTNMLVCSGMPDDLALVGQLVEALDSDVVERVNQVYSLKHAQSAEIQRALNEFLRQETQRLVDALGAERASTAVMRIEKEVSVVSVETMNQLLISASPRYYEQINRIINELDQPPPSVQIQVLLAEVTLEDSTECGFEAAFRGRVGGDATLGVETAFGVSAAQSASGGFAVSLTGADFEFILRALQAQSRLEVLSRPLILASDNQPAEISVGSRVPFITNVRILENGDTSAVVQYEDVGIILRVTPKISPDGFVHMQINPEISSMSDSTVTISRGVTVPIFNKRSATTTVTVKDNQTIVIGGLIRTSDNSVLKKIPVLGDMPGVFGAPFRSTRNVQQRTELLIVLTPKVLRSVEDAARISAQERDRISIMPKNMGDELRNVGVIELGPTSRPDSPE